MDKPLSRAIKKVQRNKKVDEAIITGTLAALGKGAAIAGKALAKGAAVVGKAGSAAAKAGTKAAKAGTKVAKAGTKVAKGMAKGSKTATKKLSLKDRMAQAADKNKDLIKNKRGLPSNNMANSGKKTVDPKKNTTTTNTSNNTSEKKTTSTNNTSQNNKNTTTNKERNKNIDKKLDDIANTDNKKKPDYLGKSRRVVKKTGEKVADATGAVTSAYGTSSFKKESITFRDLLNNL